MGSEFAWRWFWTQPWLLPHRGPWVGCFDIGQRAFEVRPSLIVFLGLRPSAAPTFGDLKVLFLCFL